MISEIKSRKRLTLMESLRFGITGVSGNMAAALMVLLVIFLPISIFDAYATIMFGKIEMSLNLDQILSNTQNIARFLESQEYKRMGVYMFSSMAINFLLAPFGYMATISIANGVFNGEKIKWTAALSETFSHGGAYVLTRIVFFVCVSFASCLFLIPGIILAIWWYFHLSALVLDDCKGISSLKMSKSLVKGRWWRTMLYALYFFCLRYVLNWLVGLIFMNAATLTMIVIEDLLYYFLYMFISASESAVYLNYKANRVDGVKYAGNVIEDKENGNGK